MLAQGLTGKEGALTVAQALRDRIYNETQLTASAGIASNKTLAKICTDINKPNGQFYLESTRESVLAFISEKTLRKVPYIGKKTEFILQGLGI
jgi:DNA polymerase kappa